MTYGVNPSKRPPDPEVIRVKIDLCGTRNYVYTTEYLRGYKNAQEQGIKIHDGQKILVGYTLTTTKESTKIHVRHLNCS